MKIGIDVRLWAESGLGRYIRNLVCQLVVVDRANEYVLFGLSKDHDAVKNALGGAEKWRFVVANFKWYGFSEQLFFPWILYGERVDVMHFPHFNIPILYYRKFIVTIHDLTHFEFAMERATTLHPLLYKVKHAGYSFAFNQAVKRSQIIICVSRYVRKQLIGLSPSIEPKIHVTLEACDDVSIKQTEQKEISIPGPYFFYVGNVHPHKNVEFLLRSFSQFRKEYSNYYLVLSGKDNYFWHQLKEYANRNKLNINVVFTGYVDDSKLAYLYSRAVAYVFPSLSEGFGLPVLEAMIHSCPVLSSNATSLPEVGGNAAIYFDPRDESSLIFQMKRISEDEQVRNDYIERGLTRVHQFGWKKMAEDTLAVYKLQI